MRLLWLCLATIVAFLSVNVAGGTPDMLLMIDWDNIVCPDCKNVTINITPLVSLSPNALLAGNLKNYSTVPAEITTSLWKYFSDLNVPIARFSPVYFFPRYGCFLVNNTGSNELDTSFFDPVFEQFMKSTNASVILNIGTLPSQFFAPENFTAPENPTVACYNYTNGDLVENESEKIVEYLKRVFAHIFKNDKFKSFVDRINFWEVLNENEHRITTMKYCSIYNQIHDYANESQVNSLKFIALGGDSMAKIPTYSTLPKDFISLHHGSKALSQTNPGTFELFFDEADAFIGRVKKDVVRNLGSGENIIIDNIFTLLPKDRELVDETLKSGESLDLYWMASSASFVYTYMKLALYTTVKAAGMGLFSTHPVMRDFGLNSSMYSSMSMMNWTNGQPNARYWGLKLLIDHIPPESTILNESAISSSFVEDYNYVCARSGSRDGYPNITIACNGHQKLIIRRAVHGVVSGTCDNWTVDNCADETVVLNYFKNMCEGNYTCTVSFTPIPWAYQCSDTPLDIYVRAECADGSTPGASRSNPTKQLAIFPYVTPGPNPSRRIIIINKQLTGTMLRLDIPQTVRYPLLFTLSTSTNMTTGPEGVPLDEDITIPPFSVSIIHLDEYPNSTSSSDSSSYDEDNA